MPFVYWPREMWEWSGDGLEWEGGMGTMMGWGGQQIQGKEMSMPPFEFELWCMITEWCFIIIIN